MHFDPWTASEIEALAQPGNVVQDNGRNVVGSRGSPLAQHAAASLVLASRREIESGPGSKVLWAVALCAREGLVMPSWLADAYLSRWWYVVGEKKSPTWDDPLAFGSPVPPATRLAVVVRHQEKRVEIRAIVGAYKRQCGSAAPLKTLFAAFKRGGSEIPTAQQELLGPDLVSRIRAFGYSERQARAFYAESVKRNGKPWIDDSVGYRGSRKLSLVKG